jgi:hypothetical protein
VSRRLGVDHMPLRAATTFDLAATGQGPGS